LSINEFCHANPTPWIGPLIACLSLAVTPLNFQDSDLSTTEKVPADGRPFKFNSSISAAKTSIFSGETPVCHGTASNYSLFQ